MASAGVLKNLVAVYSVQGALRRWPRICFDGERGGICAESEMRMASHVVAPRTENFVPARLLQ